MASRRLSSLTQPLRRLNAILVMGSMRGVELSREHRHKRLFAEPPSMELEHIKNTVLASVQANVGVAPFIVGALAFGESLAVISALFPATVILVAIGALIATANLPFWPIWLGAAIGATAGDWLSYEFARHFEDRIKHMWPFTRHPQMIERGEAFIRRFGTGAVFIGRFFGPLRAVVPLAAGLFAMPRAPFQAANVASAMLWAYLLLGAGDVLGEGAGKLMQYLHR